MNWGSCVCPYCGAAVTIKIMSLVTKCSRGARFEDGWGAKWHPPEDEAGTTAYPYEGRSSE